MIRKTVKLKNTCRMCAKNFVNKSLLMLYQKYKHLTDYPINIIQKYNFLNFKILEDDGLPQQICEMCLQEFQSINEFIDSCINIQYQIRKELNITNNKTNSYDKNALEETQINNESIFKKNIQNDTITAEYLDPIENSNETSTNFDYIDDDNNSEEYFNDNFVEDFTITCEFCRKICDNVEHLDQHQLEKHKMKLYNKYIICELCGEFVRSYRFVEHVKGFHEGKTLYNCQDCGKDFQKFQSFKEHAIRYHQSDQIQMTNDDKVKYPCTECNRIYLSFGMLRNHIKNIHSDSIAGTSKKLNQKPLPVPTFQCDICKLKFRNIVSMEKHRTNHVNEKYAHKFECPECDRRFGRRDHLKYHIKLEHLKEKPYKCQQCDKSYVIGFQLNNHIKLVHSNDKTSKRAKCDNCNKTFHNKRYLLRHQKEVHSFDAQFICVICSEKFFKHVHLIKHSQIHNMENTQNCNSGADEDKINEDSNTEIINCLKTTDSIKKNNNIDNEIQLAVSILIKNDDDVDVNITS